MPTVPTLRPAPILAAPRPQVRRQAPDADAFGAGLGQGIEQAAGTAFKVWRQEADRVNQARVLEAETQDGAHDLETWTALEKAKGGDAVNAFEAAVTARQKRQAEIAATLSNPVQREAFASAAARRLASFESRGATHVAREMERYDAEQKAANQKLKNEFAKANKNDRGALSDGLLELRQQTGAWAARQGMSPEARSLTELEAASDYVESAAESFISEDNDLAAQRLVRDYGGHLTEEAKERLRGKLEISSRKGLAARTADALFKEGKTLLEGRDAIAQQFGEDIETRDMATARFENHLRAREAAVADDEHAAYAEAFKVLEDESKDYASLPADILKRLEKRPDLKAQLMGFAKRQDRTVAVRSDPAKLVELQMMAYEDPERFAAIDPRSLIGVLGEADLERYSNAIMEARHGKKASQNKALDSITSREKAVQLLFSQAGMKPDDTSDMALSFRAQLDAEAQAFEAQHKRPANGQELLTVGAKLFVKVALPGEGQKRTTPMHERNKMLLDNLPPTPDLPDSTPEERRDALIRRIGYAAALEEAQRLADEAAKDEARRQTKRAEDRDSPEAKARQRRAIMAAGGISFSREDY